MLILLDAQHLAPGECLLAALVVIREPAGAHGKHLLPAHLGIEADVRGQETRGCPEEQSGTSEDGDTPKHRQPDLDRRVRGPAIQHEGRHNPDEQRKTKGLIVR